MANNDSMVDRLVELGRLRTPRIIRAFRSVNRADFVLEKYMGGAYSDTPLPHLAGQTISQPSVVATMLELLQPEGSCLEIGAGSGYNTALLAGLCESVDSFERVPGLYEFAKERLKNRCNVKLHLGDGTRGMPGRAFDCIIATAEGPAVPETWKGQLKEKGKLVMPVKGSLVLGKLDGGFSVVRELPGFAFVPLKGEHGYGV
jgi:protein-L-isoaspartate(D-aspartate) O-methyltransferase